MQITKQSTYDSTEYCSIKDRIEEARRQRYQNNDLARLNQEQDDLLKDVLCYSEMKDEDELYSAVLDRYVQGEVDDISTEYSRLRNRSRVLKNINRLVDILDEDERENVVSKMFEAITKVSEGGDKSELASLIAEMMNSGEDRDDLVTRNKKILANSVMQYLHDVYMWDNKEENQDKHKEGGTGAGKESEALEILEQEVPENFTGHISKKDLEKCMQMASRLKMILKNKHAEQEKFTESDVFDEEIDVSLAKGMDDIKHILPHEWVYEEAGLLERRIIEGQSLKRQYMAKNRKKKLLYMLLDVSGSMRGLERTTITLVISFMTYCLDNGDTFVLELFNTDSVKRWAVTETKQMKSVLMFLAGQRVFTGGTDIQRFLSKAIDEIKGKKEIDGVKLDDADIFLVTDGGDSVNVETINNSKEHIKIHSAVLNSTNKDLEEVSSSYIKVEGNDSTIDELGVNIVNVF